MYKELGDMRNACDVLFAKVQNNRLCDRHRHTFVIILKQMIRDGLGSSGSR
jgi:hypothetical protein